MAPTVAGVGKGSLFKRGDAASPEIFTTVVEITKIGKFGVEKPAVEATSLDSTMEDFVLSLQKGGAISIEGNALPDSTTQGATSGLKSDIASEARKNFKIVYPTALGGKTYTFTALVTKWEEGDIDPKGVVKVSFSLQVVQGANWAANASTPFYYA